MLLTTSVKKRYKSSQNVGHLDAIFFYPKIVLIENKNVVHIVDISTDEEIFIEISEDIMDKTNQDNFLWLILKSHGIIVIDILSGSRINLTVDNCKINCFNCDHKDLLMISESGEHFVSPYNLPKLKEKFADGVSEERVLLERMQKGLIPKADENKAFWKGLVLHNTQDTLLLECPISKIGESVALNIPVQHLISWDEFLVIAHELNMWIVDLKNAELIYKFENISAKYYPVSVYNNALYYLTLKDMEIHISCAWNASATLKESILEEDLLKNSEAKLSCQDTLKTQLLVLVESILAENKPGQVTPQLQAFFESIDDLNFLLGIASKLCQHNLTYKSIIYSFQNKVYASNNTELIEDLTDLIIKIDLLEYIFFKGNTNYENINMFEKKFKELCVMFISYADMDLASICWIKYNEIKLSLCTEDINEILNSIPYNLKMGTLIIWLKNFVPSLLDENPFYIDLFVKWTMERVFKLEQSGYWPKIGIKFIEEIIMVLEFSLKMVTVRPVSMDDLDVLKDSINYVMELKEKYKINMLLSELSAQGPNEVALIMLRRCYTEDLEIFLQDYLPSYAARHLFDLDDTLRSYIENEAATSGGGVDGIRLKILLNAFRSLSTKLECLLQVLKVLHVPWDSNVLELAVAAAASASKDFTVADVDRTLAQEIQKELNYAKIKVILKKYNFPPTCTDYMLVLNKLMTATTVDLQDLKVISSVITNYKNYAHILYINRCLNDCETRKALEYFRNLTPKEKSVLIKAIVHKYEQIINGNECNTSLERNYLDFLKGSKLLSKTQVNDIENLYHLKNYYKIPISLNSMYIEKVCAEKTIAWMIDDSQTTSSARGCCVSQLTRTQLSFQSVISNLLRRTSTSHTVRNVIEDLLWKESKKNTLLSYFKNGHNTSLLLDCHKILTELVIKCEEDYLHYLIKKLSIFNSLVNADIILKNLSVGWKFQYFYLPMSSLTGMNDLIDFTERMVSQNFSDISATDIMESYDFIPFRMISLLIEKYVVHRQSLPEDFYAVRDKIIRKLLSKAILCQELDEILITSLLLIASRFDANNESIWITDILKGQSDSLSPTMVGFVSSSIIRRVFMLDGNIGNAVPYPPQYILKNKFNINLSDIALPDSAEKTWDVKGLLLFVLKQHPDTGFDRLINLCRTLNVSINEGMTLQLISLLSSWDLKYKIISDDLDCRQIIFETDEKDLLTECCTIWENIENKDVLRDVLNDFWKNGETSLYGISISINPYYYEVYLCIFRLLFGSCTELRDVKEYFLLNYLKNYRRTSPPKQYEFEMFSVKGMFPEIGHYRLPFHLFMRDDMWSNLKSEITLATYEQWLPVVALLSLDADVQTARDMICSNALKQTMTSRKHPDGSNIEGKENEPWRLITREEPLLRAAHRCVRHIANMEWAGACLFYVLQGCARGADQVAAAQLCYQFAQKWAAVQPGNRAVRQMERLHSTLSTRHALHKIDWVCEEFIRLSTEPAQLIRALYLHPSFVEKMSRHDVNRAANEIADKNCINISSIRIQILESILEKSNEENKNKKVSSLSTKELMTAKYILKATCPKMGAIYLSRIAFDDESDHNKCKKLRALQCLISVIEADTAVKVTYREREALWTSLLELINIVNIENVDMPWVVATFTQDKIRAIEQLIQSGSSIETLKMAADLARRYGNMKIIRAIIPLLLRGGLYDDMIPLLLKGSSPVNEVICTAWRTVIVSPFQRADYPMTERQKKNCLNAINLLPVCPVIKDEDMVEIWKNCVRCKCLGIGCLVLPYMTSQVRQSLNELLRVDKRTLIASLKNLHTETYLVPGAMYVIENLQIKGHR